MTSTAPHEIVNENHDFVIAFAFRSVYNWGRTRTLGADVKDLAGWKAERFISKGREIVYIFDNIGSKVATLSFNTRNNSWQWEHHIASMWSWRISDLMPLLKTI